MIDLIVNSVTVWDETDGWYRITTVYNIVDNNTKTFCVKADGGSDLKCELPPREYYPNFFYFGRVVGYTTKHRQI